MADTTRDIELRLRARDLSTAELRQVVARVNELSNSLDKQLASATRLEVKERELKTTLSELDQAAKNVAGINALIQRYQVLSEQVTKNQGALEAARGALSSHQQAMAAGTATGAAAERQLQGFQRAVTAAERGLQTNSQSLQRYNEQLKQAGVEVTQLADVEKQLLTTATQLGDARTKLNETIRNYPAIERAAIAAIKERQDAERRAAAEAATSYRLQEAAQLRAFESFQATNKAQAEGHAKVIAEVQAGVAQYKAAKAAEAAASIAAQEKEQLSAFQAHRAFKERTAEAMRLQRQRFEDETARARQAANDVRAAMQQANARQVPVPTQQAAARPGARGQAQNIGFLGLRPYELQNLGYQVNDVIGGLAQGQNVTQILAQQGGQFIQIFGMAALRWFPLVAAAAGAVAVAVGAITHGLQNLQSNREFTALLTVQKLAADQNVQSLTNLRKELRDLGVDWKDAGAAISTAVGANVRGDRIRDLALTAEAMSKFSGKPVADSMKLVTDALNGGVDAFNKLQEQFPVFDRQQAQEIRRLLETNQTFKAQEGILRILSDAMKKARDEGMSPFDKEVEKLRTTWNKFLDDLSKNGAFDVVNKSLIFFTQGITNMINTMQAFGNMLESIDKRFPWLKYVALGPVGIGKGAADLAGMAADKLGLGGTAPGAGPSTATGPYPDFAKGTKFDPRGVKIDTPQLQTLAEAIAEASKSLPSGYRVEALSTERTPGSLTSNGTPSEHGFGRAIDVRIVDENNKPVPALMTTKQQVYDPIFQAFDKVLVDVLAKRGVTEVAVGGTFKNPVDAGHYSIGGREAQVTAGRVPVGQGTGVTTGQSTPTQDATTEKVARDLRMEIDLQRAKSKEVEGQLILERERIKLKDEGVAQDKIEGLAQERLKTFLYDRNKAEYELGQNRQKAAESDKNVADTKRAEAAGQAEVNRAIAAGITNYKDLEQVRDRGAAEERARISKERTDREALTDANKKLDNDLRTLELKHQSDLAQALDAVNTRYKQRLEDLDKLKDRSKNLDEGEIGRQKEKIENLRKLEEAEARRTAATKQAEEALSARNDTIRSVNRLEELGEITLTEKQNLTKKAYDDTRKSILEAAAALEKTIDPATMSETEIAKLTARVKELRAETKYVDPFWKGLKDTFTNSFASAGETFFNSVSDAIGGAIAKTKEWKDAWQGIKNAAANFFAQLLKDIANYIIKAQLAKLASSLFGGTGIGDFFGLAKPAASAATSAAGAATTATSSTGFLGLGFLGLHGGGVVGRRPESGRAPSSWWAGAPRYHSGTIVGLAPDEQAAILKRGEEVLSAESPRNILNGGTAGGVSIRNVLVDDRAKVPEAMAGAHGERVIIQHVIRNAATIRELVRG